MICNDWFDTQTDCTALLAFYNNISAASVLAEIKYFRRADETRYGLIKHL